VIDFILFCVEVAGGLVLGTIVFSVLILPLSYGLPMSLYWSAKGRLRYSSVTHYFQSAVIWLFILVALGFALFFFLPSLGYYLAKSNVFNGGYLAGFILTLLRAFSSSGRSDVREDFWSAIDKYRR